MDNLLNVVIYFVGTGFAFFTGAAMVLIGLGGSPFVQRRPWKLARNVAVMVGGILVGISAIPLDWWLYALLGAFTIAWLPLEWYADACSKRTVVGARIAVAFVWLLAVAMELPHQFTPTLPALGNPTLFLIGDSVSAGMSDADKETWPKLLADNHAVEVRDLSKMGATVDSALKQLIGVGDKGGLVLLEIGGNDILGRTTPDQFEERLELLLAGVCRRDRTVIMIELPLPPFANRFGMIQRRLTQKHDVILIPRRVFINVLTTSGATVDGIHLTPKGHAFMADVIWEIIGSAYTSK